MKMKVQVSLWHLGQPTDRRACSHAEKLFSVFMVKVAPSQFVGEDAQTRFLLLRPGSRSRGPGNPWVGNPLG